MAANALLVLASSLFTSTTAFTNSNLTTSSCRSFVRRFASVPKSEGRKDRTVDQDLIRRQKHEDISKPKAEAARITRERQLQQQQAEAARMTKKKATAFKCRRYPEAFASNTKLHDHVRTKHTKKSTPPTPPASPRPASRTTIQRRLPTAPPSGQHMRFRQMRIASYFKPSSDRPTHQPPTSAIPKVMLAPNRKHADSRTHGKSAGNRNLASFSPAFASHPTYRTCRRCSQVFTSRNLLHRHLGHCISGTTGYGTPRLGIAHCK